MWRLFTSGVFSKTPLKIAAKKNTSKGKAPRTIGFIGGPKRRTKSLHELMQESAAKPRNLRTPLRLPKQFITSSTTQEAALVTFREHPAAIAWFGLHPVIAVSLAQNLVPPSFSTSVEFRSLGPTSDPSLGWRHNVMRVLDLGCGSGQDLASWGVTASDKVTGLDIDETRLAVARERFPERTYLHGAGESLPFANESFDRVISSVALPYMNIQKALAEIHRVLVPEGSLSLSLHLPSFTLAELINHAIPQAKATIFRLYVMANGTWFHCSGRTIGVLGRTESFQTERGMKIALTRAGFSHFSFTRIPGPTGVEFLVEARKST